MNYYLEILNLCSKELIELYKEEIEENNNYKVIFHVKTNKEGFKVEAIASSLKEARNLASRDALNKINL